MEAEAIFQLPSYCSSQSGVYNKGELSISPTNSQLIQPTRTLTETKTLTLMRGGTNGQILGLIGRFLHLQAEKESGCGTSDWKTSVGSCGSVNQLFALSGCRSADGSLPSFSRCFVDLWFFEVEDLWLKKDTLGSQSTAGLNWKHILLSTLNLVFSFCWAKHLFPSAVVTSVLTQSPSLPVHFNAEHFPHVKCKRCGYKA